MGNGCSGSSGDTVEEEEKKEEETTAKAKQAVERVPTPVPSPLPQNEADDNDHSLTRLLLLGAAESGKTTLLAQIRVLYKQNYTDGELFHRKSFIYHNILQAIKKLIVHLQENNTPFSSYENSANAQNVMQEETHYSRFTPEQLKAITSLWKDEAIQKAYSERSRFNLNDSTKYFIDNLSRINDLKYTPTAHDVIMSYVPTVGVQNVIFTAGNQTFQLFDIGGQKIDRRKWATMYDGIDAIFFCLAISEYDQNMMEDERVNRLDDSMSLLEKISHEPKFRGTPMFVFLNEIDVFTQKLAVFPLKNYLPEYTGSSVEDALSFIEAMARRRAESKDRNLLQIYRTVLIDTSKMSKILNEIFKKHLKH